MASAIGEATAAAESSFADSLKLFPPTSQVAHPGSPILELETGLAALFQQICYDRVLDLSDPGQSEVVPEDTLKLWKLEQNTWELVADLYLDRAYPAFEGPSPRSMLLANPYTPEKAVIRQALESSTSLNELLIVRNWLQQTAPTPRSIEKRPGYWRFTKLELVHQLRSNVPRTISTTAHGRHFVNGLVKEMDPDVVARGPSGDNVSTSLVLEPKDAEFEKALSQALYSHIRAGNIEQAIDICRSVDQPWRSAALRGAKTFSWDAISTEQDDDDDDERMDEGAVHPEWEGNLRRKLWRKACQAGATSPNLPKASRILLASLAPSISTLSTIALGLTTWEDHLWARVGMLFEQRLDELLERYGGFWTGKSVEPLTEGDEDTINDLEEPDEDAFEKVVEETLSELKTVKLYNRFDYSHRFHWAQYHLILDKTDEMFNTFALALHQGTASQDVDRNEYLQHIRFFAHLCLFLRHIGKEVPPEAADVILQAYIAVLEEQERGDLVALYVGALGENAIQRYAVFLAGLNIELSKHDRMLALNRAKEHGLDVEAVAFHAASLIAKEELKTLPHFTPVLPTPADFDVRITTPELVLCRSVEWLTFHEANYGHAFHQANAILRYLLGFGRLQAARDLLLSLPPNLTSHAVAFDAEGPELVHFRRFFEVWDGFAGLAEVRASEPGDPAQKMEALEWRKLYSSTIDGLREGALNLFTSGWLSLEDSPTDDRRIVETTRIRQIYIPELIIRLHHELYISRVLIPSNLKHVFHLTTIVADERYGLFRDFVAHGRNRLDEYLSAVRTAGLAALEGGSRDPFFAV